MNFLKTKPCAMAYSRLFIKALLIGCASLTITAPVLAEEAAISYATADYKLPAVNIIRQDGKKLGFIDEINDGRPLIMNFVFASCSAICPMLSGVGA